MEWPDLRLFAYSFLALRSLRAHALRSFLAVLGIVIGIAAVLIVVSVAEGARAEIARQISSLGSHLLLVQPGAQLEQGVRQQAGSMMSLTAADARAVAQEIPAVVIAAPFVAEQKTAVSGNLNWSTLLAGITPEYFDAREWKLAEGQWFDAEHLASAAKVAVVGHTIVRELFPGADAIGRPVRIGRTSYIVIGVLAEKGQDFTGRDQDDIIFIPLTSARIFAIGRSQANPDAVHSILVKAESAASMENVGPLIATTLRQRHKIVGRKRDDFRIQNLVQVVQARDKAYRQFTLLVSTLAGISLLVGGIGIMNIMLISVAERTGEIGIRLVVGARPGDIRKQFLLEASLLCTVGGLLGLALGYAGARVVTNTLGWPIQFSTAMAVLAVACSSVVGIVFGILPAERAARLDPATVLRSGQ
jgi:putative ABC transport system permease protein